MVCLMSQFSFLLPDRSGFAYGGNASALRLVPSSEYVGKQLTQSKYESFSNKPYSK